MRSLKVVGYVVGALVALVYILNPTAGVFELLPDNLPVVGNLDEAAMATVLLGCIRGLRRLRAETLPEGARTSGARKSSAQGSRAQRSRTQRGDLGVHRGDRVSGALR